MRRIVRFAVLAVVMIALVGGCMTKFAGRTPSSPRIKFITANEKIDAGKYEVKGVVVVQRQSYFFDIYGLIKPANPALEEVFTDDIANELTDKAIELGANAVMDMQIVQYSYIPGCVMGYVIPIGMASVVMQATAVELK